MSNMTDEQSQLIEHVNKRTGCIISGAIRGTSSNVLFEELSWVSMETHIENITGCMPSRKLYLIDSLRTFVIVYHHTWAIYHSTNFGMQTHYEQSQA